MEKKLKLIHLVAPLISYPKIGTINSRIIKNIHIIFKIFLKLFIGSIDKDIKTTKEIDKKIICLKISKTEYSVPIKEYIARIPMKDNINGIMKSFFDKTYQLDPSKL
tara:strand:+ start:147 stop:467 length:321 start_codon:yes stop_codon:yes gene_type:complete